MKIKPIGNKIIVRRIKDKTASLGLIITDKGEKEGNAWGTIIALPEETINPFIKGMKVGDKVLYKRFQTDKAINTEHNEDFEVIDVEPAESTRQGQILAIEHK